MPSKVSSAHQLLNLKVSSSFRTQPENPMVTKLKKTATAKTDTSKKTANPLSGSVKDSAQQIWQAGLGAFTKAQVEGTKAFESLVKEGVSFQRKTQSAAEEKITEATQKMSSMATDISSKASGQWDKLESIFEDRVAKALNKLGVPSAKDITALIARIDDLNASVQKLTPKNAGLKPASKPKSIAATKPAEVTATKKATKPATKKSVPRKAPAVEAAPVVADKVNPV